MSSQLLPVLSQTTFDAAVTKPGLHLIQFTAEWCPPCRALAPVLAELQRQITGVEVAQVDVDDETILGERFGIRSLPTMLFFRDGRVIDQLVGAAPKSAIEARIRRALDRA